MNSLGVRVSSDTIFLCIISEDKDNIFEKIVLPKIFTLPEQLKYLRFNLIDILGEYEINYVSLKIIEFNSRNFDLRRCFIEGVIQETLASSIIDSYSIDTLQKIAKKTKIKVDEIKNLLSNHKKFISYFEFLGYKIENTNKEKRESFLLAYSNFKEQS